MEPQCKNFEVHVNQIFHGLGVRLQGGWRIGLLWCVCTRHPDRWTAAPKSPSLADHWYFGCLSRPWRAPWSEPVSVTASLAAAPPRPAGCSCPNSGRWGTTWRRSTSGPWRWTCWRGLGTAPPAAEPSPTPSAPSRARSWCTWRTRPITAWRTRLWGCQALRAASVSVRARTCAGGRGAAAAGYAASAAWPWRSARPRPCPAATASSTGVARWGASSAARLSPSTSASRRQPREAAMAPAGGRASGLRRGSERAPWTSAKRKHCRSPLVRFR